MTLLDAPQDLAEVGARAKQAAAAVALASTEQKNRALTEAAAGLVDATDVILSANDADVSRATQAGVSSTVVDRLHLTPARVAAMADGLRAVAGLPDPVGQIVDGWVRPNGLEIRQVRVPLGVIGVIYENRPNVTADSAGLCLKAGNAALLRGSSGAIHSNTAIATVLRGALVGAGLPADAVSLVADTTREGARAFMRLRGVIDCLIPRGGPSLIATVLDEATVPYVIDGDGNCHVYVDAAADLDMAADIVVNGKTARPSVCNATESLVVHAAVAQPFLTLLVPRLEGVRLVGDERSRRLVGNERMDPASEKDFGQEFLDLTLSVAVVDDLDAAIAHVSRYGTGHTEAIVTGDLAAARRFTREVDAAAVVVNASTRFTDGEQFGFGAEIGISTQKLHARGPMGLRELTTTKYVVVGNGQVRQ